MKQLLPIGLFVGFLLLFHLETKASHILGSELNYAFSDANNLQLNLKIYRDCSECKLNGNGGGVNPDNCSEIPPIDVYGLDNSTGKRVYLTSIAITRIGIENITNSCLGLTNACDLTSTPDVIKGIEVHQFAASFNTLFYETQGYCHFYFTTSVFSRSNEITPPNVPIEKFFNYSELDICSGIRSNSINLSVAPKFYVTMGSPIYHSPGITSGDADSISVKLVPALSDFGQAIQYISGMSYNLPFLVASCGSIACEPNPTANPPTGFYFDEHTGNTVFTPQISGQAGTLVYEVTKWVRNSSNQLVEVGKVRRDFMIQTISGFNAEPKFESHQSEFNLCTGVPFTLNIPVNDNQNITYKILNTVTGMSFSQSASIAPSYNGLFAWTPPTNVAGKTFFVTIEAKDDNCPLRAVSTKTYKLNVLENPSLSITINPKSCGNIELSPLPNSYPDNKYLWRITYPNTVTKEFWGKKQKIEHLSGGLLNIELSLNQVCKGTTFSSISLPVYTPPDFTLDAEYISCLGTDITITPKNLQGSQPLQYYWNDSLGSNSFSASIGNMAYSLQLKIEDKDGCFKTISTVVKPFPILRPQLNDSSFCAFDSGKFVLNELLGKSFLKYNHGFELNESGTVILNDNGEWYFLKQNFNKEQISFMVWVEDEHACKYYDTFIISKTSGIHFSRLKIGAYCNTASKVNLFEEYGLKPSDGFFESIIFGAIENDKVLNPAAFSQSGTYDIYFMSSAQYCSKVTILQVDIEVAPDIAWLHNLNDKVCKNSGLVELSPQIEGGQWTGQGVEGFSFNPANPLINVGEQYFLKYKQVSPELGCASSDSFAISVYDAPSFEINFVDNAGNKFGNEVCINNPVFIKLIPRFNMKDFPFAYTNDLQTDLGTIQDMRLNPDSKGGIHHLVLTTFNDICPEVSTANVIDMRVVPTMQSKNSNTEFCENAQEITIDYTTFNTQTVEWYLNWAKVGETKDVIGSYILKDIKAGSYVLIAKLSNDVCRNEVEIINPLKIFPTPIPVIDALPSQYIPYDMRFINVKDAGKYLSDITTRKWAIENKVYENQLALNHRVQAEEGEVSVRLYVQDVNGCYAETESMFTISPPLDLYIPNAFSPNGKGPESNNVFKVNAEHFDEFQMIIVNKWGEIVFTASDPNQGWDGTFLDAQLPSDVYIYYIKVVNQLGGTREFKGTVTLVR